MALAVVAVLFFLSIFVRLYTGSARLDRKWFTYRAVAESMKTLSWQYAMGTGEFPLESNNADSDFRQRLSDVERGSSFPPFPSTVSTFPARRYLSLCVRCGRSRGRNAGRFTSRTEWKIKSVGI